MKIITRAYLVLVAVGFTALHLSAADPQSQLPPSLRADKPQLLLCIPERFWTCNGIGKCYADSRPETLAAWKIDVAGSRYALCRRDGSECADWQTFSAKLDTAFLVLHEGAWHPETFKIDRDAGKFIAVRLSGSFQDVNLSTQLATITPDLSQLLVQQRTGSCIVIAK